jgi:hypothetical protein
MYSTSGAHDDDAAATDDENDTDDEDVSKNGMSSSSAQRDSMIVSTTPRVLPHNTSSALDFPSPALASSTSSSSSASASASSKPAAAVVRVRAPSIETLGAMRRLVEERAAQMRRRWTEVVRLPVSAGAGTGEHHAYAWRAVAGVSHADEIGRRPTMEVCLLFFFLRVLVRACLVGWWLGGLHACVLVWVQGCGFVFHFKCAHRDA